MLTGSIPHDADEDCHDPTRPPTRVDIRIPPGISENAVALHTNPRADPEGYVGQPAGDKEYLRKRGYWHEKAKKLEEDEEDSRWSCVLPTHPATRWETARATVSLLLCCRLFFIPGLFPLRRIEFADHVLGHRS
jgi:hypothetical protein